MRPTFQQLGVLWLIASAVTVSTANAQATPPPVAPPPPAAAAPKTAPTVIREQAPTEQQLGLPLFPDSQFIQSYDAGRGQRFYLFGTKATLEEVVAYYRTALKQRGDIVFERPATYMFEVGRYRPESMAFPPGVTVKDFTWAGSAGYPNPIPKSQPERFPTVIQLVAAF